MVALRACYRKPPVVDDRVNGVEMVRVSPTDPDPRSARARRRHRGRRARGLPDRHTVRPGGRPATHGRRDAGVPRQGPPADSPAATHRRRSGAGRPCATTLTAAHGVWPARFWPGPLTLVVDAAPTFVPACSGTGPRRRPGAQRPRGAGAGPAAGLPMMATSANRSGCAGIRRRDRGRGAEATSTCFSTAGRRRAGRLRRSWMPGGAPVLIRAGAILFSGVLEAP